MELCLPRNRAVLWLPPPPLVVGIRPAIELTAELSTKVGAAGFIERIRRVEHPLTNRQIAVGRKWRLVLINLFDRVLFLSSPPEIVHG